MKIKRGFTLVELLLGLAIAAIIGLCVYNMFWASVNLDDKMRRVYDSYIGLLMGDQALTQDLENAISLDLSASYPDAVIFDGEPREFSFITQTPKGIKRVRYFSGTSNGQMTAQSMIGRVINPSNPTGLKEQATVEFLLRQESSLADWLNETNDNTSTQIVASGIKQGSFNCQYAPFSKDLHNSGAKALDYQDSWDEKTLPFSVSCNFILYDSKNPQGGLMFKRDFFLAPVASFYNAQQQ